VPIVPDTKDWTWVLERVCPECGFDVRSFPREEAGDMIRTNAGRWKELLAHPSARERPSEDVWSALEYGCHVRDVFELYDARLRMMLEQDEPAYPNWDQDAAAVEKHYGNEDPTRVAGEIAAAGAALAARFGAVSGDQWTRTGLRSDGARFTIESFARYLIHDPVHHVNDVEKGYARLGS
jgi:hypothetical protein